MLNWFMSTGKVQYQGPEKSKNKFCELLAAQRESGKDNKQTNQKLPSLSSKENKKVFVVHGHDDVAREQLELVIHKLGLDPFGICRKFAFSRVWESVSR